jgi:CubicO group peptidase (beta-lactamase class C family)
VIGRGVQHLEPPPPGLRDAWPLAVTEPGPLPHHRALHPLPAQPPGVPWPGDDWPRAVLPAGVELGPLVDEAFDPAGPLHQTYAMVIVHHGRLVFERYDGLLPRWDKPGKPVTVETPLLSWSMAKSMLHAVVGLLVEEGLLVLDEPAPVPEWQGPEDPRRGITLQHLLEMRDGLRFEEEYVDAERSDVIQMLFGSGRHDTARFASDRPLAAIPGTRFNYSSGTSNVISGIVARRVGPGDGYRRFLDERLFGPLGMRSATATFDDAGTWVASSYVYATARDFARFGLVYLRDGVWEGRRVLPRGWVDHGRQPRSVDPDGDRYGAHWWMADDDHGTFGAAGHEGQYIDICPSLDLVLVRMGRTDSAYSEPLERWRAAVIERFAPAGE